MLHNLVLSCKDVKKLDLIFEIDDQHFIFTVGRPFYLSES